MACAVMDFVVASSRLPFEISLVSDFTSARGRRAGAAAQRDAILFPAMQAPKGWSKLSNEPQRDHQEAMLSGGRLGQNYKR